MGGGWEKLQNEPVDMITRGRALGRRQAINGALEASVDNTDLDWRF